MKLRLTIFLVLLSSLTSCSLLTSRGRQEMAYRRYVRKSSVVRARQQKKFHFRMPQMAIRSDAPAMTSEAPQSVTSSEEAAQQAAQSPALAEQAPPPPN